MTDNQLIQLFLPIIKSGLTADGFINVIVKQSDQPTMQGINTDPTVFFQMIAKKRYGFLGRFDNVVGGSLVHTERQYYETTFQVSALVLQYPTSPSYTANDLLDEIASIMQSDNTRAILNQSGVGILRVQNLPNPFFVDDRDNFEAAPSFDFVLTYSNDRVSTTPKITNYDANISRV